MKWQTLLLGVALALSTSGANATTFNLSTLNYKPPSCPPRSGCTYYPVTDPVSGQTIFSGSGINQANPWTEGTGSSQASLNFSVPGQGNNAGKIYMTAGGLFPIPTGQTLGQNQSGYSGDYALSNGFPLYFAFSNPTYDNGGTITGVPVTVNGFQVVNAGTRPLTITGYSTFPGSTVAGGGADIMTFDPTGNQIQTVTLNWTGVEEISISGSSGYYLNDIEVNDPVATPIPEPASLLLLGTGLIGLAGIARRRFFR